MLSTRFACAALRGDLISRRLRRKRRIGESLRPRASGMIGCQHEFKRETKFAGRREKQFKLLSYIAIARMYLWDVYIRQSRKLSLCL